MIQNVVVANNVHIHAGIEPGKSIQVVARQSVFDVREPCSLSGKKGNSLDGLIACPGLIGVDRDLDVLAYPFPRQPYSMQIALWYRVADFHLDGEKITFRESPENLPGLHVGQREVEAAAVSPNAIVRRSQQLV